MTFFFICKHGYGLFGSILNDNYFLKKKGGFLLSEAYVSSHC
jgi:hypothetical protein